MATIDNVPLDIAVVLGTTSMPVHQVLRLGRGAIIELDASEDDEVQILANNLPVAKGTVVVNANRILIEVKATLRAPRHAVGRATPDLDPGAPSHLGRDAQHLYLIDRFVTCSSGRPRFARRPFTPAVVAELVDALA